MIKLTVNKTDYWIRASIVDRIITKESGCTVILNDTMDDRLDVDQSAYEVALLINTWEHLRSYL